MVCMNSFPAYNKMFLPGERDPLPNPGCHEGKNTCYLKKKFRDMIDLVAV